MFFIFIYFIGNILYLYQFGKKYVYFCFENVNKIYVKNFIYSILFIYIIKLDIY